MLTGETPFHGPPEVVILNHLQVEPKSPRKLNRKVPRDLETICLKCLEKDPTRRYSSCQALADDLRRWLEGEPIQARRLSVVERAWRWGRKNPALAAALALVLVTAAGALATAWRLELALTESERTRRQLGRPSARRS
jgi:hypothetical protein